MHCKRGRQYQLRTAHFGCNKCLGSATAILSRLLHVTSRSMKILRSPSPPEGLRRVCGMYTARRPSCLNQYAGKSGRFHFSNKDRRLAQVKGSLL